MYYLALLLAKMARLLSGLNHARTAPINLQTQENKNLNKHLNIYSVNVYILDRAFHFLPSDAILQFVQLHIIRAKYF